MWTNNKGVAPCTPLIAPPCILSQGSLAGASKCDHVQLRGAEGGEQAVRRGVQRRGTGQVGVSDVGLGRTKRQGRHMLTHVWEDKEAGEAHAHMHIIAPSPPSPSPSVLLSLLNDTMCM